MIFEKVTLLQVHPEAKRFRTSICPKYEEFITIFGDTTATSKEAIASTQDVSDSSDSQDNELLFDDVSIEGESSGSRNRRRPRDLIPNEYPPCEKSIKSFRVSRCHQIPSRG